MALKQGKRTVKLKPSLADNIGIPKFPDTNIASEIAQPIASAIDSFRKVAEADAASAYKADFNAKTRDHYINLQEKFKFDPDGMKNAIDSYTQTTLANTPNIFKDYTTNILAQKNLASLNYATKNFRARNNQKALDLFTENRKGFENDFAFTISNISEDNNLDDQSSIQTINNTTVNTHFLNLNEIYGTAKETLVDTNRYSGVKLGKNLDSDIKNTEILRVFSIMKSLPKNKALIYFGEYQKGNDQFEIKSENFEGNKQINNPIANQYRSYINNPLNREDISKEVLDLYEDFNGKNIKSLTESKKTYNIDQEQEIGGGLFIGKFENSNISNAEDYIDKTYPGIKSSQADSFIKIARDNIDIQTKVTEALNGKQVNLSKEERPLFTQAMFARYGINNENLTDVNNPDLAKMLTIMADQNIQPTAIIERLNIKQTSDFNSPGAVQNFRDNLALYNFTKTKFPALSIENSFIYEEANKLTPNGKADDKVLGTKLNNLAGDAKNYKVNLQNIETNLAANAPLVFDQFVGIVDKLDVNVDSNFFYKLATGKENPYVDVLQTKDTTFLPIRAKTLITPQVQSELLSRVKTELAMMVGASNFDLNTDEGKKLFDQATFQAFESMNLAGYGVTKYNSKDPGRNMLTMFPYERHGSVQGQGLDNSIIAIGEELKNTLSKSEQIDRFGAIIGKDRQPVNITDVIKTALDENRKNIVIEWTGTMDNNGKPNYHLKIVHEGTLINLTEGDNYFKPGLEGIPEAGKSSSREALITTLAQNKYDMFMQTFGHLLDGDSTAENLARKVIYGTIKTGIKASDYKFYPDIPFVDDVPAEVKPFAFIFKTLGIDVDLKPYYQQAAKIDAEIQENISYDERIQSNSKLSSTDKVLESAFPPHKTKYTRSNLSKKYKNFVYENYLDKSLPLTFRTNNYMAVMKTDSAWNGEMRDIDTGNQAAIFASPVDSIRAGVRVMINNSTLINNNTTKRYDDQPSIEEILTNYAEKSDVYLTALESKTDMTRDDIVNFLDSEQMYKLIGFMIEHEMGSEAFNRYYPPGERFFLNAMIKEGYEQGINSYGGKLGKLR